MVFEINKRPHSPGFRDGTDDYDGDLPDELMMHSQPRAVVLKRRLYINFTRYRVRAKPAVITGKPSEGPYGRRTTTALEWD